MMTVIITATITVLLLIYFYDGEYIGMTTDMGWMPFVCADEARVKSLRPLAKQIAHASKALVKLVRFSVREEVETFDGRI